MYEFLKRFLANRNIVIYRHVSQERAMRLSLINRVKKERELLLTRNTFRITAGNTGMLLGMCWQRARHRQLRRCRTQALENLKLE